MLFTKQSKTCYLMSLLNKAENDLKQAQKRVIKLSDKANQIQSEISASYNLHKKTHRGARKKLLIKKNEASQEYNKAVCEAADAKRKVDSAKRTLENHVKDTIIVPKKYFDNASVRLGNSRKYFNVQFGGTECGYPRNYGDYDLYIKNEKIICRHTYVEIELPRKHICHCRTKCSVCKCSQN